MKQRTKRPATVAQVKRLVLQLYEETMAKSGGYERKTKEKLGDIGRYVDDLLEGMEGEP